MRTDKRIVMKQRPNPENYNYQPHSYIVDLTKYIDYLEAKIEELKRNNYEKQNQ